MRINFFNLVDLILIALVIVNSLLTNQIWSETLPSIGRLLYSFSLLIGLIITIDYLKKSNISILLLLCLFLTLVTCKLLSTISGDSFYLIYLVLVGFFFVLIGTVISIRSSQMIYRCSGLFLILYLPIMIGQVSGASEIFQIFNTLYLPNNNVDSFDYEEIKLFPTLFIDRSELLYSHYEVFVLNGSNQMRPSGLTHSNAMLSFLLLSLTAFRFGYAINKKCNIYDWIIIASLIMSGSKICQITFLVILALYYIIERKSNESLQIKKSIKYLIIYLILMTLYAFSFPAAFDNFDLDTIQYSVYYRLGDFLLAIYPESLEYTWLDDIKSSYEQQMTQLQSDPDRNFGSLSGIYTFIVILLLPIVFAVYLAYKLINKFLRRGLIIPDNIYSAIFMLVVLLLIMFATPLLGSQLYNLCIGIVLAPIVLILNKLKVIK